MLSEPGTDAIDQLDDEYANVVQAIDWWCERDMRVALEVVLAAGESWLVRNHGVDLERRSLDLLNQIPNLDAATRGKALIAAGAGRFLRGDTRGARPLWTQALADLRRTIRRSLRRARLLAQVVLFDGEIAEARRLVTQALATADVPGPTYYRFAANAMAAGVAAWLGDLDQARRAVEAALAARPGVSPARAASFVTAIAIALRVLDPPRSVELLQATLQDPAIGNDPYAGAILVLHLGFSLLVVRRTHEACDTLSRSLPLLLAVGDRRDAITALDALSTVLAREGQPDEAVLGYAAAHAIRSDLGLVGLPGEVEQAGAAHRELASPARRRRFRCAMASGPPGSRRRGIPAYRHRRRPTVMIAPNTKGFTVPSTPGTPQRDKAAMQTVPRD